MIVIAKNFGTCVFLGNNCGPGEKELKLPQGVINYFFPGEQSCLEREEALSPPRTWLLLRAT
jgi:hypothetical protein